MDNDALLPGAVHAPSDDETATGKAVAAAATHLGQGRYRVGDKGGRRRVRLLLTSSIAMVRHIYGAFTQQPHVTYLDVV